MAIATITSKGQITIPKEVRERLNLRSGDRLDFRVEEDGSVRIYPIAKTVSEVFGTFSAKAAKAYSATEIDERLRQAFKAGKL
jgi:AbrB family looped-hinge helix DNA binding protein